ncbi:MAG: tetratricopeptide repeat protein [Bacteroidales bacterium]|nr:tetratricopeptide repeat protein [Bacteroidales bacterium]
MINTQEILKLYKNINELIFQNRVKEALEIIDKLVAISRMGEYKINAYNNKETYKNILKYTVLGTEDPERKNIYNRLLISILNLADILKEKILTENAQNHTYLLKKNYNKEFAFDKTKTLKILNNISYDNELINILNKETQNTEDNKAQKHISDAFNHFWLTDKLNAEDIEIAKSINESEDILWAIKCHIVSAIFLSLMRCFDKNKFMLLLDFYEKNEERVWQRALISFIISSCYYDKRVLLHNDLMKRISLLTDDEFLNKNIETIIIQFLKSKDTEKIAKKIETEIMPDIIKMSPKLEDKLNLDDLLSENVYDEKNPNWEHFFDDTPEIYDKIEEFSKLQKEGSDVFISAFSKLKHFPFFNTFSNWFSPFYKENESLSQKIKLSSNLEDNKIEYFLEGMEKNLFMCNSDKYSFCLSLSQMSDTQKSMLVNTLNSEFDEMIGLIKEDGILKQEEKNRFIFTQYIQDLYRFYKLHSWKNEFVDIFNLKLDFYKCKIFNILITDINIIRNIAEYLFENNHFEDALEIYLNLNKKGDITSEIFEKIGYCNQHLKKYEEAINFYKKAELFDTNRIWNLKKIALCYRYLKKFDKALEYYTEIEKKEPDNLYIVTAKGHCYLNLNDFDKALKYYFKVEFLNPSNNKVMRPIAWCYFALGKFDDAEKYYSKLLANENNKYDLMNMGHIKWCKGNLKEAIEYYKKSIKQKDNNIELFLGSLKNDEKYLLKFGVNKNDIPFMIDYLRYSLNED